MDESVLLDLLECPVCLERLVASAKVLPCQHTFCRRCLQGIVGSRGELRCPECRTLVEIGVDELPSNILLVRLLDGIKQRPRRPGGAAGPSAATAATGAAGTVVAASCSTNGTAGGGAASRPPGVGPRGEQQQQQQGPLAAQPQHAQAKSTVVRVSLLTYRYMCGAVVPVVGGQTEYGLATQHGTESQSEAAATTVLCWNCAVSSASQKAGRSS